MMAATDSTKTKLANIGRGVREHRQREADEPVAADLQQDRRQDHRAGGRRLDVRFRQPAMERPHRHLDRESWRRRPATARTACSGGNSDVQQLRDVERAGLPVHRHDGQQHQHRTGEAVKEELVGCLDAPLAAPDADDQEHRDQAALEEDIEHRQVERGEHAHHQRFEDQEDDHVFAHALLTLSQLARMHMRHQKTGQHDEQHRDAVDAHAVADRRRRSSRSSPRTGSRGWSCRTAPTSQA